MRLFSIVFVLIFTFPSNASESLEDRIKKLEKELEQQKQDTAKRNLNQLRFAGLVQMDYNQYDGAYNADHQGQTGSDLFVRRVHLRIFHKVDDKMDYVIVMLADDNTTSLAAGFVRYQPSDKSEIRVGKIKEDRSLSVQYIGEELTGERPMMPNAFAVGFQWGAQGHYVLDNGMRISAGIFEDKRYAGDKSGRDNNDKLLLAYNARGTWANVTNKDVLHFGASYSYKDMGEEAFSLSERAGIRVATNKLVFAPELNSAESANIYVGEFAYQVQSFRFEAEYGNMSVNSRDPNIGNLSLSGYYLTANYFIDGQTSSAYNKKYAKFGRPSNEFDVWEVYARYSVLDLIDHDAGSKAEVSMIGTNYYINKNLHLQLQYYDTTISGPKTNTAPFVDVSGTHYDQGNAIAARVSYRF